LPLCRLDRSGVDSSLADSVKDLNISIGTKIRGANISLVYHHYESAAGGPGCDDELNLMITKPVAERYSITMKYANYDALNFATDTRKF